MDIRPEQWCDFPQDVDEHGNLTHAECGCPPYVREIIPAPDGWIAQGSPSPGDEFWYERVLCPDVQVYPAEYSGWELNIGFGEPTSYPTPAEAMNAYLEGQR